MRTFGDFQPSLELMKADVRTGNLSFDHLYAADYKPRTSCHACVYGRGAHRWTCEKSEEFQRNLTEIAASAQLGVSFA